MSCNLLVDISISLRCKSAKTISDLAVMTVSFRSLERILRNGLLLTSLILPFLLGISGYNSSLGLSDTCKARCNMHRSRGWIGSYFFNCEAEYRTNPTDKKKCQNNCKDCPNSVCSEAKDPNSYRCPETQITDATCKSLCDQFRRVGDLNAYVLNCEEVYSDARDITMCREKCIYLTCPEYMCNKDNPSILYCPIVEFPKGSDCWKDCDKYRDASTGDRAYTFKCSDKASTPQEQTDCQKSCNNCPSNICSNIDPDTRYCPSIYSPRPLPTTHKTTVRPDIPYGGVCKHRCDKYRLGGTSAYSFSCDTMFESSQDFSECLSDCLQCPSKVCSFEDSSPKFKCPKGDNAEEAKFPPEQQMSPLCIFFLVASLSFVLCFFSGGAIFWYKRRSNFERRRRDIKRKFSKRVSFAEPAKLQVPKEEPNPSVSVSSASSVSGFDIEVPSVSQSESSLA